MVELFDGFIAAVSTETGIHFKKEADGRYQARVEFEGGRHQAVLVTLDEDEVGDPLISYFSIVAKKVRDDLKLFKEALELNASLTYGTLAFIDSSFILKHVNLLENLDPQRFIKSFLYIAAKADELEELLNPEQDKF